MGLRTFPAAFCKFILMAVLAAPFAAAQDEAFTAFIFFIFALPVGIRLVLGWWIYNDAHRRGKSSAMWLVLVLISPLIGGILWWMERDRPPVVHPGYYYPPPAYYFGAAPPAYGHTYDTAPADMPRSFRPSVSCRRCGVQMPLGAVFCPSCGARQR